MAYTKYSLTPADNNAAPPNGAPEGMLPSGVNDTMRDMMSQIRDVGDGIRDGTYTMTAPKITGGTITGVALTGNTFTSPVISGGSINNTPIGATTASTGAFSTLSVTGATTFSGATVANTFSSSGATITGGSINGTAVGGTTAAAGKFTTLEATGVTTVQAGTVSDPAITTTGDTNTGIFFPAADTIAFTEGGTEAMRLDSSGNLIVGGTTAINSSAGRGNITINGSSNAMLNFGVGGVEQGYIYHNGTDILFDNSKNGFIRLGTNGTERMRIDSSGNVLVGTTSLDSAEKLNVVRASITTNALVSNFYNSAAVSTTKLASKVMRIASNGNGADVHIGFTDAVANNYYFGGNNAGAYVVANSNGVRLSNGGTSWASDSDERVKDIIEPIADALTKVNSLRSVIGKYKTDDEGTRRSFLIAQDVQAVLPEAVVAQQDEIGTLSLAYTDVIPLIVASIKELNAKLDTQSTTIQELKATVDAQAARIAALEGAAV